MDLAGNIKLAGSLLDIFILTITIAIGLSIGRIISSIVEELVFHLIDLKEKDDSSKVSTAHEEEGKQ